MHTKILFIHHSTGGNLIKEGELRDEMKKLDPTVELWDHSYNLFPLCTRFLATHTHLKGLSDNEGHVTGVDYNIVLSNNSPREYADIFSRDPTDLTLKHILTYDVIAFKNCFPTTHIASDQQLADDIRYYEIIRRHLTKYPTKQFVLLTPPPERQEANATENAKRAKQLVEWLTSKDFVRSTTNIHIFDFFSLLADDHGFLKKEYTRWFPYDSHPNTIANKTVAPLFARYLAQMARTIS